MTSGPEKWCRQFKLEASGSWTWKGDPSQTVEYFECPTKEGGAYYLGICIWLNDNFSGNLKGLKEAKVIFYEESVGLSDWMGA